jgi:hypothetical protein
VRREHADNRERDASEPNDFAERVAVSVEELASKARSAALLGGAKR